jgi:hypothetical protein
VAEHEGAVTRGASLTLLLMVVLFVFGVLLYVPDSIFGVLLLGVIVGLTFVVGFCRGYAVCDRRWQTDSEGFAALLSAHGVPVTIVPPGQSQDPCGGAQ